MNDDMNLNQAELEEIGTAAEEEAIASVEEMTQPEDVCDACNRNDEQTVADCDTQETVDTADDTEASESVEECEAVSQEETAQFDAVVDEQGVVEGLQLEEINTTASDDSIPESIAAAGEPISEKKGKKMSKKKNKGKLKWWQHLFRFIIICICLGIIAGSVGAVAISMYLTNVTQDDNKILDLDQLKISFATTLMAFDNDTQEWYEYERLYSNENRVWVSYSDMPENLIKTIIASEDKRFREHHGVDWKRTAFAFINEYLVRLSSNTQGGSTITQQLIKNLTDEKAVSGLDGVLRKIREIYRALELEKNYSKDQILEAYLNTFRLSGNVAGIEAGANYYFGKSTSDLSLAECAAIVCITKYPTANNPYLYPEENKKQRGYILYNLYDYGMITEEEYNAAKAESDAMVFDEANMLNSSSSTVYSYFTDAVIDEVLTDLQEINGLTPDEALNMLYEGGLTIYLTMDPKVQAAVEEVAFDQDLWPKYELDSEGNRKENQIEAAIVIMDYDGQVRGVAGGIREKTASRSLNRATESLRQPGSSFKPVAVYAPALELKKINMSTYMSDTASEEYNGKQWPRNYDNTYNNDMTVYMAVCKSLNTIAVHTMNLIGYDFSYDFLTTSLGYSTLVDKRWSEAQQLYLSDRMLSLALGGITDGVTVLEMTAAYQVFGNGGVYHTPHFYTMICDRSGDVILDKTKNITTSYAISEQTAYIMNQILRGVVVEGTCTKVRYSTKLPLAAKSGTTSDNNDFWVVGLNPYYVGACWMGYDQNGNMQPYSIHYDTQYAWARIMEKITKDLPYKDFPRAEGVVSASFCLDSGDLATGSCPRTRTGYYTPDNMPDYCVHNYLTAVEEDKP